MKINKQLLLDFLNQIRLKGDVETVSVVFNISKSGIKAVSKSSNEILALRGVLKTELEDIGEVGIGNLSLFNSFVNNISSENVIVEKKTNKLSLKSEDNRFNVSVNLVNPEYIKLKVSEDKFEGLIKNSIGNEFTIDKETISKIKSYCDSIRAVDLILEGKDKELTLKLFELDNSIVATFDLQEEVKPFKIKFQSSYLLNVLTTIQDKVTISCYTNKFMYLKTDMVEYVVAPIEIKE